MKTIPEDIPVLLDVKRGDISTTAQAYATAAKQVGAHGVTLNAYMGYDAIKPFLEEDWGGCFILCKTSNPSSNEFQILRTRDTDGALPLRGLRTQGGGVGNRCCGGCDRWCCRSAMTT